jgi:hypothetical protein
LEEDITITTMEMRDTVVITKVEMLKPILKLLIKRRDTLTTINMIILTTMLPNQKETSMSMQLSSMPLEI